MQIIIAFLELHKVLPKFFIKTKRLDVIPEPKLTGSVFQEYYPPCIHHVK